MTGTEVVEKVRGIFGRWFGEVRSVGDALDRILIGGDRDWDRDRNRESSRDVTENRWGVVLEYVRVVGRVPVRIATRKRRWIESGSVEEHSTVNEDEDVVLSGMGHGHGHGNQDEGDDDEYDNNDNDDDNDDIGLANTFVNATNTITVPFLHPNPHHPSHLPPSEDYFYNPSVIEVSRQVTRYRVDRPGDATNRVVRKMSQVQNLELEGGEDEDGDVSEWWRKRTQRLMGQVWVWEGGMRRSEVVREEVWIGCCFW